jgi:hypothetical protein
MNTNLVSIVKQIITDHGEAVLADPQRLKAFFSDLAKDEPKPLRASFGRCIEEGAYEALKTALDKSERAERKAVIAQRVRDEHGLDTTLCGEALDILEAALTEEENIAAVQTVNVEEGQDQNTITNSKPQSEENSSLKKTIETLIKTVETLTREKNQSDSEKQQKENALKKTKKGLGWAIILGILAVVISIGVGVSKYNEMEEMYYWLQSEMDELSVDYEKSKTIWAINVTSIEVGNCGIGKWLTQPGGSLNARDIRYLNPVITYNSLISREVIFYVKIIDPYGIIHRNNSRSPAGYSYSSKGWVARGTGQSFDLFGWGNEDGGSYFAGKWTVEVWYEGVCLRSEKIKLN